MTKTFNWQQVIRILGVLLMTEALFMVIAAIVAYIYEGDDLIAIVESAVELLSHGTKIKDFDSPALSFKYRNSSMLLFFPSVLF